MFGEIFSPFSNSSSFARKLPAKKGAKPNAKAAGKRAQFHRTFAYFCRISVSESITSALDVLNYQTMEKKNMAILPGVGLGIIKFGMNRDEVRKILGDPDEVDQYGYEDSDDEEDQTEAWHYDSLNASFSFDALDEWRLNAIAVSDPEYLLNNKSLIGLSRMELQETLSEFGLGEVVAEEWSHEEMPEDRLLSIDDVSMNFWMEDDQLAEIQWGPHIDEDDNVHWPE